MTVSVEQITTSVLATVFPLACTEIGPTGVQAVVKQVSNDNSEQALETVLSSVRAEARNWDWQLAIEILFGAAAFVKTLIEIRDLLQTRPSDREVMERVISKLKLSEQAANSLLDNAEVIVTTISKELR